MPGAFRAPGAPAPGFLDALTGSGVAPASCGALIRVPHLDGVVGINLRSWGTTSGRLPPASSRKLVREAAFRVHEFTSSPGVHRSPALTGHHSRLVPGFPEQAVPGARDGGSSAHLPWRRPWGSKGLPAPALQHWVRGSVAAILQDPAPPSPGLPRAARPTRRHRVPARQPPDWP